jgi:hypothetical protein
MQNHKEHVYIIYGDLLKTGIYQTTLVSTYSNDQHQIINDMRILTVLPTMSHTECHECEIPLPYFVQEFF